MASTLRMALCVAGAIVLASSAPVHADHVPTNVTVPAGFPTGVAVLRHGDIEWIANAQAAHGVAAPLGETLPFERDGRWYLIASDSIYGLTIVDVKDPKRPRPVSTYASSSGCPTAAAQFVASKIDDVAGEPAQLRRVLIDAGLGTIGWENDLSATPDGRIAVIGTDAPGRCHDPEYGGLEFVDVTDVTNPRPLHLVRNVGYAHSVSIDPFHPWLAYVSSSDGNDFVDVVDFRSCLGGVAEIEQCKPAVSRIPFTTRQYRSLRDASEEEGEVVRFGCHDIRFTATRAYCAAIDTTLILDTSAIAGVAATATTGTLTGTLMTGGAAACPVIDATRAPGVKVTDCSGWTEAMWEARRGAGAAVRIVAVIKHDETKPPDQDIQISHQAEPMEGGKILAITDERGGGLNEGAPACPGGGIWFYDIRDEVNPVLMKTPDGRPAVFITEHTAPSPFSCTVHYGEQFGSERVLAFAWYTGGTHIIKITPDYSKTPATIAFEEVAAYIPAGSWAIQSKPVLRDPDDPSRILVYTADAARGLDVFSVKVPRPLAPKTSRPTAPRPRVLGRALPATGVWDPMLGVALLAIACALASRMRDAVPRARYRPISGEAATRARAGARRPLARRATRSRAS